VNTEVYFDMPHSLAEIRRKFEGTSCGNLLILKLRVCIPPNHQYMSTSLHTITFQKAIHF